MKHARIAVRRIAKVDDAKDRNRFHDSAGDDADGDGEKRHIQKCTCRLGKKSRRSDYVKDAQTLSSTRTQGQWRLSRIPDHCETRERDSRGILIFTYFHLHFVAYLGRIN